MLSVLCIQSVVKMNGFTHVDEKNNPCMVDVSDKLISERFAHARCEIELPEEILKQFKDGDIQSKKGPVFHTAIIAGTMGLKKTSELIPFCHQINIEGSQVEVERQGSKINIDCKVRTVGKTGVEMEALMGAHHAALTIYDMCKAMSHDMKITNLQLIEKSGGKNDFKRS